MQTSFHRLIPRLALLGSLLLPLAALAQTAPIRIMPLGDSITDGSSFDSPDGSGGYRLRLYNQLTSAGYNVDYIGSLNNNGSLIPDPDHEGHSGWRIDQLDSNMAGWLANLADPDVVLMHIGTNDFGTGTSITTAIDRFDALILKIATLRPYAHIIVTNLMEREEPNNTNIQTLFNPFVQARVNAHAAAGRRVTFLDMRSVVPLADMPDSLHPNQTGYDKMADAWLPAIQAVIAPDGDTAAPAIARAAGNGDRAHVAITFSKPVADTAAAIGNFALSGGLTVSAAVLDASKRIVTLTTSAQAIGGSYTVTVNGVVDRTAGALALPANSTVNFNTATQRGYLNNVPESAGYTLAYSLDLPSLANYASVQPAYAVDNHNGIGPFSRIAYYLELQTASGELQYVWASVNAFTTDAGKIAVPTLATGAVFQQAVTGMNVVSNFPGLTTGTGLVGNLEFWPTNYEMPNIAGVTGASDTLFDFGDKPTPGNYGSMQLHNAAAAQTVFAFNNWGGTATTSNLDVGIGNDPAPVNNGVDWTFANNAAGFTVKTLQVLVQTTGDTTAPTLTSATTTFGRTQVLVHFSEPLALASLRPENFTVNGGVLILGVTLAANQRDVTLLTTTQPAGTPLTLTVSGVRDCSPAANRIVPNSTIAVGAAALPPEIVANVGAPASAYQLVASIEIPVTGNFNTSSAAYTFDERATATAPFTRVAYYMETQRVGQPVQYVWTSMDAFTTSKVKLGVPTVATGAVFQQNVTNLNVLSNVAGVVTGTTATGGNIEFWPNTYTAANALAVPNASTTNYDTGDTITSGSYGSMQVHNHDTAANQTVFALNNFGTDGQTLELGIGNDPAPVTAGVDWTFANNAGNYSRRILHVLILPVATPVLPASVAANVPAAAGYQLVYSLNIPASGNSTNLVYSVNNAADVGPFTRIAYYLELQTGTATPSFVWTSMDAFTTNAARIGVPTVASGAFFLQNVTNLDVLSNVAGIVNGTTATGGNIEFWPSNYTQANASGVPNASTTAFDFGDSGANTASGYGSMQVHNHDAAAKQTLFAFNHFGATTGSTAFCLGIGNRPGTADTDWTFADNSGNYSNRTLHVFVLPGNSDLVGPTITGVKPSATLDRLVLSFNEPLADNAALAANFTIPGLTVTSATLLSGQKDIILTTSPQTPGTVYTVNVTGVRDRSRLGNLVLAGTSTTFTAFSTPAIFANVPEIGGYKLIYKLIVPAAMPQWNSNAIPYAVDESRYGEQLFDRVGYLLELDGNWAYASFDRHTNTITKVGVPSASVFGSPVQQTVAHLNVASNVAGVVNGTDIATGNIEFWAGNYTQANALGIPNASATAFDFGDTMTSGGHGCMQVHNYGASQTVFAYNNWGANTGGYSEMGIGNNPNTSQAPDWTSTSNANSAYTTRNLYVFVRPGGTATGSAPVLLYQPTSRTLPPGASTTFAVTVSGSGPFTYQWRYNGTAITGATSPWLDLTNLAPEQSGGYDVIVTGPNAGSTTSLTGALTVVNHPPTFSGYAFTTRQDTPVMVPRATLLAKAADLDGHSITLTAVSPASAQGGTVSLADTGVTYTPATGFLGADTFTITLADGFGGSVVGTVNATVTAAATPDAAGQARVKIRADGNVDVLFIGTPGKSYEIQRSTDVSDPGGWSTLATRAAGDDGFVSYTDPSPPIGRAFYRTHTATP